MRHVAVEWTVPTNSAEIPSASGMSSVSIGRMTSSTPSTQSTEPTVVAPKARSIFTNREHLVGLQLDCPDCSTALRVETASDHRAGQCPDIVGNAGPLGFVVRCDACGCRIEMKENRLPRVDMMRGAASDGC
jgi:hypothetical protein